MDKSIQSSLMDRHELAGHVEKSQLDLSVVRMAGIFTKTNNYYTQVRIFYDFPTQS